MRSRSNVLRVVLVGVALMFATTACEGWQVNEWLVKQGKAPVDEASAAKIAAALTPIEAELNRRLSFVGEVHEVDAARLGMSWHPGCPVGPESLRLLRVSFHGYDGATHVGEIIVARERAAAVVDVFRVLFNERFPIQRMETIEKYNGDDNASMLDNNTSAFNCRFVAGTTRWSMHAYGQAIDMNTLVNPYVQGAKVSPPEARIYVNRTTPAPGKITAGSIAVRAFAYYGWKWGGFWSGSKDYQHFSTNGR
jgi:hypothetical protein